MDRTLAINSIGHIKRSTADGAKLAVETLVQNVLDQIGIEGREPDAWEGELLMSAIGAACCGMYSLALAHTDHALVPPAQRSPQSQLGNNMATPTSADLEHGLAVLRAEPPVSRG